jgi:hypothetical protein
MDTPFSSDLNTFMDPVKVDFLVLAPQIWCDAGLWCPANAPNTLRQVFDKYPKFVDHIARRCVVGKDMNAIIEIQRVITSDDLKAVHTACCSVHELISYLETQTF